MKIFVTGATGFIGSLLVNRLAGEGHDVTILVRNPSGLPEFTAKGIHVLQGDIFDMEVLKQGTAGCDRVYHLAAYARPTSLDNSMFSKTNIEGTENVLNASQVQGVRRVIITSTAGTIGYSADGSMLDETAGYRAEYHTEYERTKALAEQLAIGRANKLMDVVVVNPTRVFGPGKISVSNSVTRIIDMYCRGTWRIIPGDGSSVGNYSFIDDVVGGHILAAENGRSGERYILGGENVSFNRFFEVLGGACGRHRKLVKISGRTLKAIARFTGHIGAIAGKPPLISEAWIDKYLNDWVLSGKKAEIELSYKVTPFEEGVEKTVSWLKGRK